MHCVHRTCYNATIEQIYPGTDNIAVFEKLTEVRHMQAGIWWVSGTGWITKGIDAYRGYSTTPRQIDYCQYERYCLQYQYDRTIFLRLTFEQEDVEKQRPNHQILPCIVQLTHDIFMLCVLELNAVS